MRKLLLYSLFIIAFSFSANGQQTQTVTQDFVDDATKAFTEVVALRAENKILKDVTVIDLQKEINRLREELALKTGELIGVKQSIVECRADVQFLLTNGRIKKYGLINF